MTETRDRKRSRILNHLISVVKQGVDGAKGDDELEQILMKLYLDLQKRKRSLVTIDGEE